MSQPYPRYGSMPPTSSPSTNAPNAPPSINNATEAKPPDARIVRQRKQPNFDVKQQICTAYMENPKIRHQALAEQFGTNRSTVSRTLQDWAYWQSIDEAGLRLARRMCVPVPLAAVSLGLRRR